MIMNEFNPIITAHKNCSYCNKSITEELWCKECDPFRRIEGWTTGNSGIDKIIKDTMYHARQEDNPQFLEWVPFDRFEDIKQIGEGGFAKVYSATWKGGKSKKVALKRLNESQDMSAKYLNEVKTHWNVCLKNNTCLKFYGITKDPETREFMMIIQFADKGNLRNVLSNNFNNTLWGDKIRLLMNSAGDLKDLHGLGYFHKDFHSGNILQIDSYAYISDFGLSGPVNEQISDDKICGVLPYIAPEVLNGKPYTLSSDIYSFGVVMAELSSGKPPFHNIKHDIDLALAICNGLRPEFGEITPEIYKKLSYRCMSAIPDQRPTANELFKTLYFWHDVIVIDVEKFNYKGKEIGSIFKEADKEIPKISISYEKDPDAIYTSRIFAFNNLPQPVNSSTITSYIDDDNENDSGMVHLEVPNTLKFRDDPIIGVADEMVPALQIF